MFVAVLAAETDETRQAITMLILGLVGIAVLLSLLTVWYWRFTSPKRRALALFDEMNRSEVVESVGDLFEPAGADIVGNSEVEVHAESGMAELDGAQLDGPEFDGTAEPGGGELDPGESDREPIPAHLALVSVIDGAAEAAQRIDGGPDAPTFDAIIPSGAWLDAWAPDADDELTRARRRRSSRQDVLSDDDWAAAMRSAFDHYRP